MYLLHCKQCITVYNCCQLLYGVYFENIYKWVKQGTVLSFRKIYAERQNRPLFHHRYHVLKYLRFYSQLVKEQLSHSVHHLIGFFLGQFIMVGHHHKCETVGIYNSISYGFTQKFG